MDYSFANGVISALETKVLDRNKLYVLNKYEKDEFVKVLLSMNYGGSGSSLEELIQLENKRVKEVIDSITPCKKNTDLFYLINDALNLKVLYKNKLFKINKENLMTNTGAIPCDLLKQAIIDNNYEGISKEIKNLIIHINNQIDDTTSPKNLSSIIDNEIYQYALNATNDLILKKYIQAKIDLSNVISLLRAHNLNWNVNDYLAMFVQGGLIKKDELASIYDQSKEEQIRFLSNYYNELISKVLAKTSTMNEYQLDFDRLLIEIMSEHKNDPFSIGPMIYYYLLKQAEAQNIRILYSLKNVEIKDLI